MNIAFVKVDKKTIYVVGRGAADKIAVGKPVYIDRVK